MQDSLEVASEARDLFVSEFGSVKDIVELPGAGSDRRYFRIFGNEGTVCIATYGENTDENKAFIGLAKVFKANGASVPEIFAVSRDFKIYLQEDLGDIQLASLLFSPDRMHLSNKALEALADVQLTGEDKWEDKVFAKPFSKRLVMWDLNYFKYEFLKPLAVIFDEEKLEDDFEKMTKRLCDVPSDLTGFMYRDFQSRNVMIKEGKPYLIDFQGGRKGPLIYDAVSFLWQAKARFSDEEREALLQKYAGMIASRRDVSVEKVLERVDDFALFRTLQVLGAYGFRGLVEKKTHFIESIPGALDNLNRLMQKGSIDEYPELKRVAVMSLKSRYAKSPSKDGLTVKVYSFSYKKGYPEDLSGNGGGFMFDCRGMHNPGRYEEFKRHTGLDPDVRKFLEERGEAKVFVSKAVDLVSPSVERYLQRGFSSLQIGFGCTGGRHRSVYCADAFAGEIASRFPTARVEVIHREQGLVQTYDKKR